MIRFLPYFVFALSFGFIPKLKADSVLQYVNPFIGTTNFGTTNPGSVLPHAMMSVSPFNVMGSPDNLYDKDARWWSTPYEFHNTYFTGFSHVNLSGVGCPEMGALLLMPTTGELEVDYTKYGSAYTSETSSPAYYSNYLTKYDIKTEVTSTLRSSRSRFTFPQGQGNILLNLGQALSNETGAQVNFVSDQEIEGVRLLGTFCYHSDAVFPLYFVMRFNKAPQRKGYWKKQRQMIGVEAEWDTDQGQYKIYDGYTRPLAGDDIGAYLSFDLEDRESVEVQVGVSFVSIENARLNLDKEQQHSTFEQILNKGRAMWQADLSRVEVEGGTEDQKQVFYTSLYHALIHPSLLSDVNGEYPIMESNQIGKSTEDRYTVFSLWDTYRNVHQLLTLLYPERQIAMIKSMMGMYEEYGWLPKWELFGRETLTMEGDPSIPVLVDSWKKGLQDFDIERAYEAMYKSATAPSSKNLIRPDNDDYQALGYVPLREPFDNSVSHALEYYVADHALGTLAEELGKKEDAKQFYKQSKGYKNYYCPDFGTLRPKLPDGQFYENFNPKQGENFEACPGFHEGTAWNYTFFVPHDIPGLVKLMGGKKKFIDRLQYVFDEGLYDPTNEPDIAYPYLFSYYEDEAWRTQKLVKQLLEKHFTNTPNGLPGNDDAGTMSTWAIFSMMGFYPDCPGVPGYTLTTPTFDKITLHLSPDYYPNNSLVIEKDYGIDKDSVVIESIYLDKKKHKGFRISHQDLVETEQLHIHLQ